MSVDIDWHTITDGPDGQILADQVRDFIHERFQQVPLPRFIKSVKVLSFAFGSACPRVEIKDICDPLPNFYEDDDSDEEENRASTERYVSRPTATAPHDTALPIASSNFPAMPHLALLHSANTQLLPGFRTRINGLQETELPRTSSPGIPGGTSNFSYFHLPIGSLSGTQTPLANLAGGVPMSATGWTQDITHSSLSPFAHASHQRAPLGLADPHHHAERRDPSTRPSTADTIPGSPELASHANPSSPEGLRFAYARAEKGSDDPTRDIEDSFADDQPPNVQPSDVQVVARVQYTGDIRMTLTAEILIDYPMPSFVGIPLKLSITGMSFDGVALLAHIGKRMHFCFLDPDDAQTLVGDHVTAADQSPSGNGSSSGTSLTGLLQNISIESDIGRHEDGKQGLKNVGKVEKFVLEQIRRTFEDEFVFPSFWTFLV